MSTIPKFCGKKGVVQKQTRLDNEFGNEYRLEKASASTCAQDTRFTFENQFVFLPSIIDSVHTHPCRLEHTKVILQYWCTGTELCLLCKDSSGW